MDIFFWTADLLIPAVIALMGLIFCLRPPRRINMIYGSRCRCRRRPSRAAAALVCRADRAHPLCGASS